MSRELTLFIEQIIEQEIDEVAVSPQRAESSGYALFTEQRGRFTNIVLFNPAVYGVEYKASRMNDESLSSYKSILGIMFLEKDKGCKTWRVAGSAAVKGYGPLVYDVALTECGSDGLAPDKGMVSASARNVWLYNFTTRKNDFLITKFGPPCAFTGKRSSSNTEEYLDCKYVLKTPLNLTSLKTQASSALTELKTRYGGKPERDLVELAEMYFATRS